MKRVYIHRALFGVALTLVIGWMSIGVLTVDLPTLNKDFYADILARKIEEATGKKDFDNVRYVKWTSVRNNDFVWDKTAQKVLVRLSETEVILNLQNLNGSYILGEHHLEIEQKTQLIDEAYSHFCNDSFWLIAPYKFFDKGVERTIVHLGSKKLLAVRYTSGGVTPGDTYLWRTDENFMPTSIQMWTDKIPIDGLQVTWEEYKTVSGRSKIALSHKFGPLNLKVKHLEVGNTMQDLKLENNPFLKH